MWVRSLKELSCGLNKQHSIQTVQMLQRWKMRRAHESVFVQESGRLAPVVFGCVFAGEDANKATKEPKPKLCDYLHLTGA